MALVRLLCALVGAAVVLFVFFLEPADRGKTPAYYATMKADLRNLVTAQEHFWDNNRSLPRSLEEIGDTLYQTSAGVTVALQRVNDSTWTAEARHVSVPTVVCRITAYVSTALISDLDAGVPLCQPPLPPPGSLRWRWPWR